MDLETSVTIISLSEDFFHPDDQIPSGHVTRVETIFYLLDHHFSSCYQIYTRRSKWKSIQFSFATFYLRTLRSVGP